MRTRTLVSLPLLVVAFGGAVGLYSNSQSKADNSNPTVTTLADIGPAFLPAVQAAVAQPAEPEPVKMPEPNPLLVQYLESNILAWSNLPECEDAQPKCVSWKRWQRETVAESRSRFHSIAVDVAQAAAVEKSPYDQDPENAKMANLVLTLGFMESGFKLYVDDGRCNDRAWQKTKEGASIVASGGTCDGTLAHSLWQIHPDMGIFLLDPGQDRNKRDWTSPLDYGGPALRDDITKNDVNVPPGFGHLATAETITGNTDNHRLMAARTAWHMARQALRYSKFENLCAYTGEWRFQAQGICPKGKLRLDFANKWWKDHPFTLPRE